MKRSVCLLIVIALLIVLPACKNSSPQYQGEEVLFYYCTDPLVYDSELGVISPERRYYSGSDTSLDALLNLYLSGPIERGFRSPFPDGLFAENVTLGSNRVHITLCSMFSELNDLDLTLACVCLSKTLQETAKVDNVYITYENSITGNRHTVTIGPDSYELIDQSSNTVNAEE